MCVLIDRNDNGTLLLGPKDGQFLFLLLQIDRFCKVVAKLNSILMHFKILFRCFIFIVYICNITNRPKSLKKKIDDFSEISSTNARTSP